MELFLIILFLLAIIGLSSFINHLSPYIPVPLIQVALGVLIASLPLGIHVPIEPNLFFILFIAPLLFYDGKNVSRHALWRLRKPILLLALGLVFITVYIMGYFIHWLIPSIPLPASFALAAILSPTDVVAVSAISSRVKIPETIMHILEGEGLMNDASGLVAFKFAVAATVTGTFSMSRASFSFLAISVGGLVCGALLAFIIIRLKTTIRRLGMEDVTIHMLIQLLTPFLIYYIAEYLDVSGILSVVAAGLVHTVLRERDVSPAAHLQVVSQSTWTVLIYILNGLVFLLLGLQIPSVAKEIFKDPLFNNWEVSSYIVIITGALLFLRFLWIGIWSWLLRTQLQIPSLRSIGMLTVSGVRGAVTLAGAFTIPFVLGNGEAFPERSLLIFIASGVILMTILAASVFLPILAKTEKVNRDVMREEMEKAAKLRTIDAAIRSIQSLINEENRGAALSVISIYNQMRNRLLTGKDQKSESLRLIEAKVRMDAVRAEAHYIEKLKLAGQIDLETQYVIEQHLQRKSLAVTNRFQYRSLYFWTLMKISAYRLYCFFVPENASQRKERQAKIKRLVKLKVNMAKAAIHYLMKHMTTENENVYMVIVGEYNELIVKVKNAKKGADSRNYIQLQRELRVKAFQAERDEIQSLYEEGEVTIDVIRNIRKQINIREAYWMDETSVHSINPISPEI